ncbi:MAG: peptidoglycan D,D-transpeptidase FtsI family protein [Ilumatobacteraceae bacterium]
MNQRIRHLTVVLLLLFGALFVSLTNWQVRQQNVLKADGRNNRTTLRDFDSPRGRILTSDNKIIADTLPVDFAAHPNDKFNWQRVYPNGELYAHLTGYYTFGFGSTQVEKRYDDVLAGRTAQQQLEATGSLFDDADTSGTVHLTVDSRLQEAARDALAGREGSAVVLDPRTGAVLAMYSNPSFDPNKVATHDGGAANEYLAQLNADERKPLLANAYQERYMPGSTFKIVTTTVGLETGALNDLSVFEDSRSWTPPDTKKPIRNYGKKVCGGDLAEVFRRSCNIPFAQTAVTIGPSLFVNGVNKFGFDEEMPFDLPGAAWSTFGGTAAEFDDSLALLAIHGFGQGEVQVVPMHLALIAAAVANNGAMPAPYAVADTRTAKGTVISATKPRTWKTPMAAGTAEKMRSLMRGVVENGTASCCLRLANGVQAAAKTGTAQLNPEGQKQRSHAWITAFAPAGIGETPRAVVAVMLKGVNDEISTGTGGRLAGPVAKTLLDTAMRVIPPAP